MLDLNVAPIVPGRNADELGNFVGSVNRAALVASCNDNRFFDIIGEVFDNRKAVSFPLILDGVKTNISFCFKRGDKRAFAQSSDYDGKLCTCKLRLVVNQPGLLSRDPFKVLDKVTDGSYRLLVVGRVNVDDGGLLYYTADSPLDIRDFTLERKCESA